MSTKNVNEPFGAAGGSATAGRVKARMEGAAAAIAGRKLDANTYHEDDDLHWQWLAGWTDARMARMKSPNDKLSEVAGRTPETA